MECICHHKVRRDSKCSVPVILTSFDNHCMQATTGVGQQQQQNDIATLYGLFNKLVVVDGGAHSDL